MGFFSVSAGEYLKIRTKLRADTIILIKLLNTSSLLIRGNDIKIMLEDIKQVILFFAWTPNAKNLITLNSSRNIITSLNIFNIKAIIRIIISLYIVKYNPSKPYIISSSLISLMLLFSTIISFAFSKTNLFILSLYDKQIYNNLN
jgi:hypothetical protein